MNWSYKYNELPIETRRIASIIDNQHRIADLKAAKKRLRRNCERDCREIDDLIKSLNVWICKLEREIEAQDQ